MDNRETKEIDSMARIAEQVDLVTTMGPTGWLMTISAKISSSWARKTSTCKPSRCLSSSRITQSPRTSVATSSMAVSLTSSRKTSHWIVRWSLTQRQLNLLCITSNSSTELLDRGAHLSKSPLATSLKQAPTPTMAPSSSLLPHQTTTLRHLSSHQGEQGPTRPTEPCRFCPTSTNSSSARTHLSTSMLSTSSQMSFGKPTVSTLSSRPRGLLLRSLSVLM